MIKYVRFTKATPFHSLLAVSHTCQFFMVIYSCCIYYDGKVRQTIAYKQLGRVGEGAVTTCFTKISCFPSLLTAGIPITDQILVLPPLFHDILSYAKTVLAASVPKIAGSIPAEAVGFFERKKSTACLPWGGGEVKPSPMSQICAACQRTLGLVEVEITGKIDRPFLARNSVFR